MDLDVDLARIGVDQNCAVGLLDSRGALNRQVPSWLAEAASTSHVYFKERLQLLRGRPGKSICISK